MIVSLQRRVRARVRVRVRVRVSMQIETFVNYETDMEFTGIRHKIKAI